MNRIKNTINTLILIAIAFAIYTYRADITKYILHYYTDYTNHIVTNEYALKKDYINYQITNDFNPKNKKELINVLYTILDSGINKFSFYPDNSYTEYENDLNDLINGSALTAMNNYVHPFNSFSKFNIAANNYGIITISIDKTYNSLEIAAINTKLDLIMNTMKSKNTMDEIRNFHDYIIKTSKYDEKEAEIIKNNIDKNLSSNKAYNVLINGMGLCGGYTDTMAIFLNRIGVDNFKVANETHTWNVVKLNDQIYHLDVTWDDPVTSTGTDMLIYDYFMITTDELKNNDTLKHNYDTNTYPELG